MAHTFSFIPLDSDGKIILDKKILAEEKRKKREELARKSAFCSKSEHIESLISALGSQGIGCGHVHHNSSHVASQTPLDEESQERPSYPHLEIKEAEDCAVRIGKMGEIITSLGGALAIAPVLDLILMMIDNRLSKSPWFKPNAYLETSPAIFLVALVLVIPAIYGGPHCHAQLEIASRTKNNFLSLAKYSQKLLKWGLEKNLSIDDEQLKMPKLKIDNHEIPIDEFVLISKEEAIPLSSKQKLQIFGDVEQHFNEYVGLTIIAIVRNIKNLVVQLVLAAICLLVAAKACYPEVKTCANTLRFMNTLRNGKVIHNPSATNKANFETKFSAFAKIPAVFYANLLSFQQICFGNFYAGLVLALLTTKGNIVTQYFINTNTQALGEPTSKQLIQNVSNAESKIPASETIAWQKLTIFGKELVITRAFGTGNERSQPITIITIAFAYFLSFSISQENQCILALLLCLAGTLTAYSEARNAADHTVRVRFFNKNFSMQHSTYSDSNGLTEPLLSTQIN